MDECPRCLSGKSKMTSKKLPYMKFYYGDWLKDIALQSLSYELQGIWLRLLCFMYDSSERGVLTKNGNPMTENDVAMLLGLPKAKTKRVIFELISAGILSKREDDSLYSKRMVRDELIEQNNIKNGSLGGNSALKNAKKTSELDVATTQKAAPKPAVEDIQMDNEGDIPGVNPPLNPGDKAHIQSHIQSHLQKTLEEDDVEDQDLVIMPEQSGTASSSTTSIPSPDKQSDPVVMTFPTENGNWPLRESKMKQWEKTFPNIDVRRQAQLALQWLLDNPTRKKTKRGMTKYLGHWMRNAKPRSQYAAQSSPVIKKVDIITSTDQSAETYNPKTAPVPFNSPEFRRSWVRWHEYTVEIGKPVNGHVIAATAELAEKWGEQNFISMVQNSVSKGYKSLIPPEGAVPVKQDKPKPAGNIDDLLLPWQLPLYGSKSGKHNLLPEDRIKQEQTQGAQS